MRSLADPALPGLPTALDGGALLELLSRRLPECRDGVRLLEAQPIDVQYAPGERCVVLHRVKLRLPSARHGFRQLVHVEALREGALPAPVPEETLLRYAALRATPEGLRESPLPTPVVHLPEAGLVVRAFPVDPVVPWLVDAVDRERVQELLGRAWTPRHVRVRRVDVETLAYTPGSRAALYYEVLAEDRATKVPEMRRLVGKIHCRRSPARLFAGAWAVWRSARGRVGVAPPVGWIAALNLSLQEHLRGERLSDLAGTGRFGKAVKKAAYAIARVHPLQLPLLSERTVEKEVAVCRRWAALLAGISGKEATRVERLTARLVAEMEARFTPRGTVHADFHLANVMVQKDSVTIVDWDQVASGDPMLDVGRFLASLRVSALRTHGAAGGLADAEDAFLATYLRETGEDERRARLFEAEALLIAAGAPFRLQREGWEDSARALLDEAEQALESACRGASVAVAAAAPSADEDSSPSGLPFDQRVEWLEDGTFTLALLVPMLREAHGPGIEAVTCRPHVTWRDEESAHVSFEVSGFSGAEAWSARLAGHARAGRTGSGAVTRVEMLREAASARAEALQLPRALGHVASLGLMVVEPAEGEPLEDALAGKHGPEAAARLARALAALQAIDVPLGKERALEKELRALERRVARLVASGHGLAACVKLLAGMSTWLLDEAPRVAVLVPTVRGLSLHHVVLASEGMATQAAWDAYLGVPGVAAGSLLAQLAVLEVEGAASGVVDAFRAAWLDASRTHARDLGLFEAMGLLRVACSVVRRGGPDAERVFDALVERAHDERLWK